MPIETITCPKCGFSAQHVSAGGRGRLTLDIAAWSQRCVEQDPNRLGECHEFDEALTRPRQR